MSRKQISSLTVPGFGKGLAKFGLIYVAGFVGRYGMGGAQISGRIYGSTTLNLKLFIVSLTLLLGPLS
ncbi:hypothetical protein V6N12_020825 [Hibiscus sabdariffa]|uniref:Uncharacterized protein n=1 Tax=Hibiscus sabdariffa TaxID=183260 RepID=A0ABR2D0W2_9ROSI